MIGPAEAAPAKEGAQKDEVAHGKTQKAAKRQNKRKRKKKRKNAIILTQHLFTKQRIIHTETMNNIPQTINNMSHHGRRIDAHNTFLHQLITSVGLSFANQENLCNLPTTSRKHQQLLGCVDSRAPCMFCILSRRPQYIKPCRHGKLQNNFAQTCHTTIIPK